MKVCCETLGKYIENIVLHPDDEKFRKIRQSNKAYQERVLAVEGALLFIESAGFQTQELPFNDSLEKFWVRLKYEKQTRCYLWPPALAQYMCFIKYYLLRWHANVWSFLIIKLKYVLFDNTWREWMSIVRLVWCWWRKQEEDGCRVDRDWNGWMV